MAVADEVSPPAPEPPPAPPAAAPTSPKPLRKKRSWRRRWIPRFLVAIFALLIVVIVIAQIVIDSTIPKEIVIAQVQNTLGLRLSASSLKTSWLGHTTLKDVQLSLPLADKPFATVPSMRVSHTILPLLVLTQSIDIDSIELDQPHVTITQNTAGQWNLLDVKDILLRSTGGGSSGNSGKPPSITLPSVVLKDGTIDITDNKGRHASLAPLTVTGSLVNPLVWTYDVRVGPDDKQQVLVTGRVVASDNFKHEATFTLAHLAPIAQPWVAGFDPAATIFGSWSGALSDGGISGRLLLKRLNYAKLAVSNGDVQVQIGSVGATITPTALTAQLGADPRTHIRVSGGSIHADANSASVQQLDLAALDGHVRIDGTASLADQIGNLTVNWNGLHSSAVDSTGSFSATLKPQWPNQYRLATHLVAVGSAGGSPYSADVSTDAVGKSWDNAAATVQAAALRYDYKSPLHLDGLFAHFVSTPGQIAVNDISLPVAGEIAGTGALLFDAKKPSIDHYNWWLTLTGQNIPPPMIPGSDINPPPINASLNAWGNEKAIDLNNAYAAIGHVFGSATGVYNISNPKPVDLNVYVGEATTSSTQPATTQPFMRGYLRGDAHVGGTVAPLDITLDGDLHGRNLFVGDHSLQDVDVRCTGVLDKNHAAFDTEEMRLLGGHWQLHARTPGQNHVPEATLSVHDLQLASAAELVQQKNITGSASASIDAELDSPNLNGLHAVGTFSAADVHARQLIVDTAAGSLSLLQGQINITPIHLTHLDGHADASLKTTLAHPEQIVASLNAGDWPVDVAEAHAVLGARTDDLSIDAIERTANGQLTFQSTADFQGNRVLDANGAVKLLNQTANLNRLNANVLGGTATGTASVTLSDLFASRAEFHWNGLNLNALSPYEQRLKEAGGSFSGQAILAPDPDPRRTAPLLFTIDAVGDKSHVGPVQIAGFHLPIGIDHDRIVLDHGSVNVADGTINLFARVSLHGDPTEPTEKPVMSALLNAQLDELDLDQLLNEVEMSSTAKESKATTKNQKAAFPGRVDGNITVAGNPQSLFTLYGSCNLQLHDSDLGNFGPFAALYNTMHLGGGGNKPNGTGTVMARYDNDNFIVTDLRYFNRGTYAYGLAEVDSVMKYPLCAIQGTLAGTFRPLRNIKLPFFADADQIFSTLQGNLTSIVLGGTVQKPTYTPQSAAEISNTFKTFLVNDAKNNQQK